MSVQADLPLSGREILMAWIWGALQFLAVFLFLIWLAFKPVFFDWYYPRFVSQPLAGDAGTIVRWVNSTEPINHLNVKLKKGMLAPDELDHYADVRNLLRRSFALMWIALSGLILLGVMFRPRKALIRAAQARVAVFCLLALATCISFAAWDWPIFFAWMHYPFFGATSWKFARGAYSLILYPPRFWQIMGILIVGGPLLVSLLLACGSLRTARRVQKNPDK